MTQDQYEFDPARNGSTNISAVRTYYVLALLMLVNTMNAIDRVIVNILVEPIRVEFGLSDTQIAAVAGLGFALFYGLLGIPIARLADRGNRTHLLAIGLATWSAMTVLTGRASGFWTMLCARFGVGVGEAACYPAALSLIGDYFSPQRRPLAISLFQIGIDLGFIIGAPVAGFAAAHYGWRMAFTLVGVPGVVLALWLVLTVREPVRGAAESGPPVLALGAEGSWRMVIRLLSADRVFALLAAASTLMTLGGATLALWGAAYMMRSHGLHEDQVGALLGPLLGGGGFAGTIVGGVVGSRIARRSNKPFDSLKVMIFAVPPAAAAMALFVLGPTVQLAITGGLIGGFLVGTHYGPLIATTISRVAPENRGLASSVLIIGQSVIGFGLGPLIVGAISDQLSGALGTEALRYAMLFAPACAIAGWTCAFVAYRQLNDKRMGTT